VGFKLKRIFVLTVFLFALTLLAYCANEDANKPLRQYVPICTSWLQKGSETKQSEELLHILSFFQTSTKQFMPLGFYAMESEIRNVENLKYLREHGLILFHKYHSEQSVQDALRDLGAAQNAGVAILQNLPKDYLFTKGKDFWQEYIKLLVKNDQILVWYLPEEIKFEDLDKLEQLRNLIRANDPKHRPLMTYVESARPEYLKKVGSIVDATAFGAYPTQYGNRPRIDVERRVYWAYKSGVPVVIAALETIKGKYNWTRPKDVRFDAYLALISGAKGIMWFGYYQAKLRPELLNAVLGVATELNGSEGLGEVLLSGKEPETLRCENLQGKMYFHEQYDYYTGRRPIPAKLFTTIQWTAREYKNYLYIFAVNTAQKVGAKDDGGHELAVKIKFNPITTEFTKAEVIGEKRVLDISENSIIDTFEPLETHIYKIKLK
jgi:hypothetical protein